MAAEPNYVYRVRAIQHNDKGEFMNVTHVRRYDTVDPPTDAMLLAYANALKEAIRGIQSSTVHWDSWDAEQVAGPGVTYSTTDCKQSGGLATGGAFTGTTVGPQTGDPMPAKDAIVVSLETGLRGKSKHGRLYIAGSTEAGQSQGVWDATTIGAVQTAFNTFTAAYGKSGTNANLRMVIFSRVIASGCKADPTARHHPLVHVQTGDQSSSWAEVTAAVVNSVVYSQRSRTVGKGI